MKFAISHKTVYQYGGPVRESFNEFRLKPLNGAGQSVESYALSVSHEAAMREYTDFYGNHVESFEIASAHEMLSITAESVVNTSENHQDILDEIEALDSRPISSLKHAAALENIYDFVMPSRYAPASTILWRFAMDSFKETNGHWNFLKDLNRRVYQHFQYTPGSTEVDTPAEAAFEQKKGVCQDYAHVFIAAARSVSVPVRYVSGYLYVSENSRQEDIEISAYSSHAWVEAFVPEHGWIGFDPTHNSFVDKNYITIARGRDYGDARPISGTYRGASIQSMEVAVSVKPVS